MIARIGIVCVFLTIRLILQGQEAANNKAYKLASPDFKVLNNNNSAVVPDMRAFILKPQKQVQWLQPSRMLLPARELPQTETRTTLFVQHVNALAHIVDKMINYHPVVLGPAKVKIGYRGKVMEFCFNF